MKQAFSEKFQGFSPRTLRFFHDLDTNNNREWFAEHRERYLCDVAEPMKRLAAALISTVRELDPRIVAEPARAVSRIYRDTRYARDKSPYRPRMWLAFKRNLDEWTQSPVFFFQVQEQEYLFGMGMYTAAAATMRRFRGLIDNDPNRFLKVLAPFQRSRSLRLESESYKRPLPHRHPAVIDPWYQSKTIGVLGRRKPDATLFSARLVDLLIDRFVQLKPLYDFLWEAVEG